MNEKIREHEILRGHVLLVKAMLINVFDRIRIKDSWHRKKISKRMLLKKETELADLGVWLHTAGCKWWFHMLGLCTGMSSKNMLDTFIKTHSESIEFIRRYKAKDVDTPPIDSKRRRRILEG